MLEEGQKAPNFCLKGLTPEGEEKEICLEDFLNKGKYIIVYFYPKDNTPGCTTEACDFRDNMNVLADKAIVIGISPDSIESHKKFKDKYNLNFYLLSDPEKKVLETYDAYGEKKSYGKVTKGVIRSTYIVSPEGKVVKKWRNVRAKGHVAKVVDTLNKILEKSE
jgi:peroxiredoxin Q/BCP